MSTPDSSRGGLPPHTTAPVRSTPPHGGHISRTTEPFLGDALENPDGAAVHLAVAPHGTLDPEFMPGQIQTPTAPVPDIWWLAFFD